jgi:Skp family chaperone for outer membrane proteins
VATPRVINQSAIDAAKAAEAARAKQVAAAQAKVSALGTPAELEFTKNVAPRFSALSDIAQRVSTKAGNRPEVLSAAGITLDELGQKTTALKEGAATYTTKAADITKAEEELARTQTLYGTPVSIPTAQYETKNSNSAYDLLLAQFSQYGLGALVEPLKNLITNDTSEGELTLLLRQTEPYKKRFAANASRLGKGLRALSEAEYLALEDGYQSIMRNYGLPASYYTKGDFGTQAGFEKFIAGDVSPAELEERVITAQNRVLNAPPQVKEALQRFYPDINNSDILTYTLDPEKGLADIKRKVTAAEIGGAAIGAGLETGVARAEELAKFGVTAEAARQGYQAAVPIIQRGGQLAGFYGEEPYTQVTAEEELFNLPGSAGASQKRKRLTALEEAQFSGRAGMTGGALARDRAGAY